MARLLVERETIFTEEVDMIMDGKSVEEIMQFMDKNEGELSDNPFSRKSAKDVIIPGEKTKEKATENEEIKTANQTEENKTSNDEDGEGKK